MRYISSGKLRDDERRLDYKQLTDRCENIRNDDIQFVNHRIKNIEIAQFFRYESVHRAKSTILAARLD